MRSWVRDKNALDLLLITPGGDVVYTVDKEADFASNLRTGPWRATGLARAFEGALAKASAGETQFEDFESYPASGKVTAFLAKAIKDQGGKVLGVLVIEISDAIVRDRIADRSGRTAQPTRWALTAAADRWPARGGRKLFDETPHGDLIRQAIAAKDTVSGPSSPSTGPMRSWRHAGPLPGRTWFVAADLPASGIEEENRNLALRNGLISAVFWVC